MRTCSFFLFLVFLAFGQDDIYSTHSYANGRGWQRMNKNEKVVFLKGFFEGMAVAKPETKSDSDTARLRLLDVADGFVIGDYEKEIDNLYSDTANIRIPVASMVHLCTEKFNGLLSKGAVEEYLGVLRQTAKQ